MEPVHIHLLLNHVPVIGTILGLLLVLYAIWTKSREVKRATFLLFVILAIISVPVYFTGEPAEETVEELPGVSEAIIEEHEEIALVALIGSILLGVVGAGFLVLYRGRPDYPSWSMTVVLLLCLASSGLFAYTSNLGGQIRHSEIRSGGSALGTDAIEEPQQEEEHEKD